MGILNAAIDLVTGGGPSYSAGDPDPSDDRWWLSGPAYTTATGIHVTPRMALGVSCFFQGLRLIAETLAALPLKAYRDREDGGKDPYPQQIAARALHATKGAPNPWQTGMQLRETMIAHAILWGTGYSEIRYGPQGLALVPLDPETVDVEQLDSFRLRYTVRAQPDAKPGSEFGQERTLVHEQVFRVQGLAIHRFMPPSLLALSRETVGQWLATQRFNSLYFAQGAGPQRLFFEHPSRPSEPALKRMRETVSQWLGGLRNMHRPLIGEGGMKPHMIGWNAEESQLVETWSVIVAECARWLNLPMHLLMQTKEPTFASVVEFGQQFKDLTLIPWARRLEGAINRDLVPEDDVTIEHNFQGLLRGRLKERLEAYAIGLQNRFYTTNEVRGWENLNPVEGGDEIQGAANIWGPPSGSGAVARRLRVIAQGAARYLLTKELRAVTAAAARHSADPGAWSEWLAEWYGSHAHHVAEVLELPPGLASWYCDQHRRALKTEGLEAAEGWEDEGVQQLVGLALETEEIDV